MSPSFVGPIASNILANFFAHGRTRQVETFETRDESSVRSTLQLCEAKTIGPRQMTRNKIHLSDN